MDSARFKAAGIGLAALLVAGCGGAGAPGPGAAPGSQDEVLAQAAKALAKPAGPVVTDFRQLVGYDFEMPMDGKTVDVEKIPEEVRAYDGKSAKFRGYMMVLDFDKGRTKRFLLMKDAADCCFGGTPQLNEWVMVDLPPGKAAQAEKAAEVVVEGKLQVGPKFSPEGWIHSIYQMTPDEILGPDGTSIVEAAS